MPGTLGGCETGQARLTGGYDVPARHVIHAVGPASNGGGEGEDELIESCFRHALPLCTLHGLKLRRLLRDRDRRLRMSPKARRVRKERAPRGAYIIQFALPAALTLVIARGSSLRPTRPRTFALLPGTYLYVGSARGPGGLAARVLRHLAARKTRHWDIDFLLHGPRSASARVFARASTARGLECRWARRIARARATFPVVGTREGEHRASHGFGAGDCTRRCGCDRASPNSARTHLFRVEWEPTIDRVQEVLRESPSIFAPIEELPGVHMHAGE